MKALILLAGVLACGREAPPGPRTDLPAQPDAAPAESLAVRLGPGVEIWYGAGRAAQDSSGGTCFERTLLIRDSAGSRQVPLLYTLEAPSRLDDTSMRARVYRNCQPGDAYRVALSTGRPTPLAP